MNPKSQKKPKPNKPKIVISSSDMRHNPDFLNWHKANFTEAEHAEFLEGGVLPPFVRSQIEETTNPIES